MYVKLALRNAKKSVKDYLIYVVTLTLCVGLFYSFMSICSKFYVSTLPVEYDLGALQKIMRYPVIATTALLIFLVMYVNNYMLKRRQKEFAIQTLLGMEQKNVARLFFAETLLMGLISIVIGIILGAFFSQILSSMVMNFFKEEYQMYFSLFPDTMLITILFFCFAFIFIGSFNIKKIRKMKIIDMFRSEKELNSDMKKEFLMPVMVIVMTLISLYNIYSGMGTFDHFFNRVTNNFLGKITIYANIILPFVFVLAVVGYMLFCIMKRKFLSLSHFTILLLGITVSIIIFSLLAVSVFADIDRSIMNKYFIYACVYLVFFMFTFFYSLSSMIQIFMEKSIKWKYKGNLLFLLGQINARLQNNSRTMSVLAGTILLAMTAFIIDPILSGWAMGYLDKRAVYDIQIDSVYNSKSTRDTLPTGDFSYVEDVLRELNIKLSDAFTASIYFMDPGDFVEGSTDDPMMAMSLSDYNHLRTMAGYDEIQLAHDEFTIQWHYSVDPIFMENYLKEYKTITVDGTTLKQSENMRYMEELGEVIYSFTTNGVVIINDSLCDNLLMGKSNYYGKISKKQSYEEANDLYESIMLRIQEVNENNNFHTSLRMRTLQRNDGISAALIMKLLLNYGGIVLLVISFTMLSLQQLTDSSDFKHRFHIIRKMGVSNSSINKIIYSQMSIWFGLPILLAGIAAFISGQFYIQSTKEVIRWYIGMEDLYLSLYKMLITIVVLFACYFLSTWILFKKNIGID